MAQRRTPVRLAADLGAEVLDTSITLWWRWPILLASGMTRRDKAELTRMVSEKATAGTIAAQTETMRITARALRGEKKPRAYTAIAAAALKHALRTVKANAKRLRKKALTIMGNSIARLRHTIRTSAIGSVFAKEDPSHPNDTLSRQQPVWPFGPQRLSLETWTY